MAFAEPIALGVKSHVYVDVLTASLYTSMHIFSLLCIIMRIFWLQTCFGVYSVSPFLSLNGNHCMNFATKLSRLTFESKKLPFFSDFETQTLTPPPFSSSNVPAGSSRRLDRLLAVLLLGAMTEPNLERETLRCVSCCGLCLNPLPLPWEIHYDTPPQLSTPPPPCPLLTTAGPIRWLTPHTHTWFIYIQSLWLDVWQRITNCIIVLWDCMFSQTDQTHKCSGWSSRLGSTDSAVC